MKPLLIVPEFQDLNRIIGLELSRVVVDEFQHSQVVVIPIDPAAPDVDWRVLPEGPRSSRAKPRRVYYGQGARECERRRRRIAKVEGTS